MEGSSPPEDLLISLVKSLEPVYPPLTNYYRFPNSGPMGVYTLMIAIRTLWSAPNVFNLLYPFSPIAKCILSILFLLGNSCSSHHSTFLTLIPSLHREY
jgi:hypothetical protein